LRKSPDRDRPVRWILTCLLPYLVPRLWPTGQKKELVEVFKKDLKVLLEDIIPVWFFDETGFSGWSKAGESISF